MVENLLLWRIPLWAINTGIHCGAGPGPQLLSHSRHRMIGSPTFDFNLSDFSFKNQSYMLIDSFGGDENILTDSDDSGTTLDLLKATELHTIQGELW